MVSPATAHRTWTRLGTRPREAPHDHRRRGRPRARRLRLGDPTVSLSHEARTSPTPFGSVGGGRVRPRGGNLRANHEQPAPPGQATPDLRQRLPHDGNDGPAGHQTRRISVRPRVAHSLPDRHPPSRPQTTHQPTRKPRNCDAPLVNCHTLSYQRTHAPLAGVPGTDEMFVRRWRGVRGTDELLWRPPWSTSALNWCQRARISARRGRALGAPRNRRLEHAIQTPQHEALRAVVLSSDVRQVCRDLFDRALRDARCPQGAGTHRVRARS